MLFTSEYIILGASLSIGSFVQMVLKLYDLFNMGLTLTGYNMLFVFLDYVGFATKVTEYMDFNDSKSISGTSEIDSSYKIVILSGAYISQIVILTFLYGIFCSWTAIPADLTTAGQVSFRHSENTKMIIALIVLGSILLIGGIGLLVYKKLYPPKKDVDTDDDYKYVLHDNIEEKVKINDDSDQDKKE